MSKNSDLDRLRNVMKFPQPAPSKALVLRLAQELEETRAKHRKEWGRAEAAEAAVRRVREVCGSEAYEVANEHDTYDAVAVDNVLDALDGGEQE